MCFVFEGSNCGAQIVGLVWRTLVESLHIVHVGWQELEHLNKAHPDAGEHADSIQSGNTTPYLPVLRQTLETKGLHVREEV